MNWKLIFLLSLFGLAMALLTVSVIPEKVELPFWILIFIVNAIIIARQQTSNPFATGFLISLVNCIYIVFFHVMFYQTYVVNHPMAAQMAPKHVSFFSEHPRMAMVAMGPLFGIGFGIVQGLFAWAASKIMKKPAAA